MKTHRHYSIEILESRIAPANIDFVGLADGLKTKLDSIQLVIDAAVGVASLLPVVGDKIASAGKVIDMFSDKLRAEIDALKNGTGADALVSSALYGLLGSVGTGLNILGDTNGDGSVSESDVVIQHPGLGGILIDISLHAAVAVSKSLGFNIGLGALPITLESNAAVAVTASLDYHHLQFGISDRAFVFYANDPNDLQVNITAGLTAGSSLTATVGFLSATIKDGAFGDTSANAPHTQLSAGLTVDVNAGDIASSTANFHVTADIALQIDAEFNDNFPGIGADFRLHYSGFDAADAAPTVNFKNVRVNLGGIISNVLAPIFDVVTPILTPIKPVLDFISAPIPVLSDLSHAVGAGDITLIGIADVAATQAPLEYQQTIELISTAAKVLKFADSFKVNPDTHNLSINFGDFQALAEGNSAQDLRTLGKALDVASAASDGKNLSGLVPAGFLASLDINAKIDEAVGNGPLKGNPLIEELKNTLDQFIHPNGITYSFPFLDHPADSVFGMLLGRDADLFTLDAKLKVSGQFKESYPIGLGISVGLAGAASADLQLHLGYDTFGVREFVTHLAKNQPASPLDFLDGFYLRDTTHVHLDASIVASAGIDVVIASVEIEGGVSIGLHIDLPTGGGLNEVDNDIHKVHLRSELKDALFLTTGGVDAFLDVALGVGIGPFKVYKHFDIAHVNILSFGGGIIPNPFTPPSDLHLASTLADDASVAAGTLRLNVGADAVHRGSINQTPGQDNTNEHYQVFVGGEPGDVVVYSYGYAQTFKGITKIIGDAGGDDDTIIFQSVKDGPHLTAAVEISGGTGNDQIVYHGDGSAKLFGGAGDDVLIGGAGANYLNGGDGNDNLTGGTGANLLGHFVLGGVDYTEAGNDTLIGGDGLNTSDGGDGDDALFAGKTNGDTLTGGRGDDQLVANTGTSTFLGGAGDDTILWKHGDGVPTLMDAGSDIRENNTLQMTGSDDSDTFSIAKNTGDTRARFHVETGTANPFNFVAHGIQNVMIEGGKGADKMVIFSLTGTPIHSVGLNLNDVLSDSQGLGDNATDIITVIGSTLADTAQIEAEQVEIAKGIHDAIILGGVMKVSGLQSYVVRLANVDDDFTYNATGGNDTTTLLSNTGPTRLLGGAGNDLFTIVAAKLGDLANPANPTNPKDYLAAVSVDAGTGVNQIVFDESGSVLAETMFFGQMQFHSTLIPAVDFIATGGTYKGGVTVKGGQFGDTLFAAGTLTGVTTNVLSGAGNDTINIGGANASSGSLDAIGGPLVVDAGAGANQLVLIDVNDASGNSHVGITATQVVFLAGPSDTVPVSYAATNGSLAITIEGSNTAADVFTVLQPAAAVTIHGNGGDDIVKVAALSLSGALTFSGGAGNDTLTLGAGLHSLDGFILPVNFSGGAGNDTLTLDDTASLAARSFGIHAASVTFGGIGIVGFDATLETANVLAGKFADTFAVTAAPALSGSVNLDGGLGANQLSGPAANNIWNITAADTGTLNSSVRFAKMPNLLGGSGSDRFIFANAKGITGTIGGGTGSDTLDYAAYTGPVTVNLLTAKATNVLSGISDIENANGGAGADLLVGNALANVLTGGAGKDILIGGYGADTLTGGTGEDLLIGGATDYDALPAALDAIQKEWRSAGDYLARIAHITTGGGLNGATLLTAAKVQDDMIADTLSGGPDTRDWFFARLLPGGMDLTDIMPSSERNN